MDFSTLTNVLTWSGLSVLVIGLGILMTLVASISNSETQSRWGQATGLVFFIGGGSLFFSLFILLGGVLLILAGLSPT